MGQIRGDSSLGAYARWKVEGIVLAAVVLYSAVLIVIRELLLEFIDAVASAVFAFYEAERYRHNRDTEIRGSVQTLI